MKCGNISAIYRYKWWFLKLNPRLMPPNFRREQQKLIVVNGKRRGYAEIRAGQIPLDEYRRRGLNLAGKVGQLLRDTLGFTCRQRERGYIYVKLARYSYIVLHHTTPGGLEICEVYELKSQNQIGTFIFNQDFTEVSPHSSSDGVFYTLCVIIGYVADTLVYSRVAGLLEQTIRIKM